MSLDAVNADPATPVPTPAAGNVVSDNYAADLAAVARIGAVKKILEVVSLATGLGFSAVARVTEKRWIACDVRDGINFGLGPGGELEIQSTICDEIRQSGQLVVIDDTLAHPTFCNHPTPKRYGFRSYISVPIVLPDGRFFGTLCAIDPNPAKIDTPQIIGMFKLFAELLGMHLASQERMALAQADLSSEREAAKLRDQFMAVLGHDLRNPLNAIQSGIELLQITNQNLDDVETLEMIQRSVMRMAGLIGNVLDFARGRLGGGIPVHRAAAGNLQDALNQVIGELASASPNRTIQRSISVTQPIFCDPSRIAQLLSNLLGNALTHGDPAAPIEIHAATDSGVFTLSVTNRGATIPPETQAKLFEPFVRGSARPGQQGLGLGLYIASEIAKAHCGRLEVASADGQTRFSFSMPVT